MKKPARSSLRLASLAVVSFSLVLASNVIADARPNLLFIMVDDLGVGQCGPYAQDLTIDQLDPYFKERVEKKMDYTPEESIELSKIAMPTLQRLADQGVLFTRAFSATALCASARLSVATGMNQQTNGIYTNIDVEASGLQEGTHLAERLQGAGYATAHIGKWHMAERDESMMQQVLDKHGIEGPQTIWSLEGNYPEAYDEVWESGYYGSVVPEQNPLRNGFDLYYGYNTWASQFYDSPLVWDGYEHAGRQRGYNTEVFTEKALEFMHESLDSEKPFFVQLHYHAVHDWLEPNAPAKYRQMIRSSSYTLRNFYSHVYAVDANIQRIVDELEERGELENTLIVFTSDNGAMAGGPSPLPGNAPFSGHKGTFNQGGLRVPLVFSWPAGIQEGRVLDHLVSSMDILPTFLDAAGLEVPELDGKSLKHLLTTESAEPVREQMVFSGVHARRWGFLIHKSYKDHYTEFPFAPGGWAVVRGDHVLRFLGSVGPMVYHEYPEGTEGQYSMFNYAEDPAETRDLKESMPELFESLKKEYYKQSVDFGPPVFWEKDKWIEIAGGSKAK